RGGKGAPPFRRHRAHVAQETPAELRVRVQPGNRPETVALQRPRTFDALAHLRAALPGRRPGQLHRLERVRFDVQVEPVENGTGNASPVSVLRGNAALAPRLSFIAAGAGVHRGDEHEARREERSATRAHHRYLAVLERL